MANLTEYDMERQQPKTTFPETTVLGVDPGEPEEHVIPDEPEVVEDAAEETPEVPEVPEATDVTPDAPNPDGISMSQEEYDRMSDDSQSLRTIMGDPKLAQVIYDHLRNGSGGAVPQTPDPNQPQAAQLDAATETRISNLEQQLQEGTAMLQQSQQQVASLTLNEFSRQNPEFNKVKTAVLTRMRDHPTLSLADATKLVVAENTNASSQNVEPKPQTRTESVEGNTTGVMPVDHSDPTANVMQEIAKAKDTDAAFDLAFNAALKKHGA